MLEPFLGAPLVTALAKSDRLPRKTNSFTIAGQKYLMVNYYTIEDVLNGRLPRPRNFAPGLILDHQFLSTNLWAPRPLSSGNTQQTLTVMTMGFRSPSFRKPWLAAQEIPTVTTCCATSDVLNLATGERSTRLSALLMTQESLVPDVRLDHLSLLASGRAGGSTRPTNQLLSRSHR
jgi:hypothetical protein